MTLESLGVAGVEDADDLRANQPTVARKGGNVSPYSDFVVDTGRRRVVERTAGLKALGVRAGIKNGGFRTDETDRADAGATTTAFLGVRHVESLVAQPIKDCRSPRLSVPSASSRPRHAAARLLQRLLQRL
jgi:hypothetical protein